MHALMRVMWSGKWAVVTPHALLNAVWELTPCFRGYTQQDAQEFLWSVRLGSKVTLLTISQEVSWWVVLLNNKHAQLLGMHQLW